MDTEAGSALTRAMLSPQRTVEHQVTDVVRDKRSDGVNKEGHWGKSNSKGKAGDEHLLRRLIVVLDLEQLP